MVVAALVACTPADTESAPPYADLVVEVPEPTGPEGRRLLGELLGQGVAGESLGPTERRSIEELVRGLLPASRGELTGHRWEVFYFDLPVGDHIGAELFADDRDTSRRLWLQVLPAPSRPLHGFELDSLPALDGRPVVGRAGHHLFVRVGELEVRMVADPGGGVDDAFLRRTLAAVRLDILEKTELGP